MAWLDGCSVCSGKTACLPKTAFLPIRHDKIMGARLPEMPFCLFAILGYDDIRSHGGKLNSISVTIVQTIITHLLLSIHWISIYFTVIKLNLRIPEGN